MYSEPCAMLTMRVTPKMSDRPADRKNSDEAFARPFKAWSARTSSGSLLPRAHLPHFGIGRLHRGAVDVFDVDHRAAALFERDLADPRPHGALVVDRAVRARPGSRVGREGGEGRADLLRLGAARLGDARRERPQGDLSQARA